jgi:alkanesulfonate monooxygenase SsuD/methylene tetrahydromethanopterin reductase-like flavin-dependent oxidoreductase (luciferase family)
MRVGASLRSVYTVPDVRTGAAWMIARARAAADAGLDSLFVGDHHNVPVPYYQNTPMLGRLLAEWDDRPSGALYLLPLHHPVMLAEHIGTLASIARGRFIMQCAVGGGEPQFAGLGADLRTRGRVFEENLAVIRKLLDGQSVDVPRLGVRGARISPTTPEPLEVWIGGHAPRAIDRAARVGEAWLAGPEATYPEARALVELYRDRCRVHGRSPTAVAVRRDVHVGADDADAERVAGPVLRAGYRGFEPSACVVGGPETVAGRFAELAAMGYTDVVIRHLAEDEDEVLRSFERLARVRELVADA